MDAIVIEGGHALEGEVEISGAKNAALPILCATILAQGQVRLTNVPDLRDVRTTLELLRSLGGQAEYENRTALVRADSLSNLTAPYELVKTMRASVMVLGPLTARYGRAKVSLPGGCAIGSRPINLHIAGLKAMGAEVRLEHGYVITEAPNGLTGADIFLDLPTVTGTENLIMAATLAKGTTTIRNAAREPEIADLASFLNAMGARVSGAGEGVVTIEGVDELTAAEHAIMPDRIEAGTFMVAAGITASRLTILNAPDCLAALIGKLEAVGLGFEPQGPGRLTVTGPERIRAVDVKTEPYPGFPTDMQAQFMALMCLADGLAVINETVFENRFIHVEELRRLGARIRLAGSTAIIEGVGGLTSAPVMATDLRASASLVLAGLAAHGLTEVNRVYHLDRGYEKMEEKFKRLGARIRRIKK